MEKKIKKKERKIAEYSKPRIYGLKLTEFIHWMRDHKFSLDEARHVLRENGFVLFVKAPKPENGVSDHTVRAHLHCFPKYCKGKAPKMEKGDVKTVLSLKKSTPKESDVPGGKKKPAAAKRSASKPATKKTAKPKDSKAIALAASLSKKSRKPKSEKAKKPMDALMSKSESEADESAR